MRYAQTPQEIAQRMAEPPPIFKGKTLDELTMAELKECLLHFRSAHLAMFEYNPKIERRMRKMELALTKEQIATLDWWLEKHALNIADAEKGGGQLRYWPWTQFKLTSRGYRCLGDTF